MGVQWVKALSPQFQIKLNGFSVYTWVGVFCALLIAHPHGRASDKAIPTNAEKKVILLQLESLDLIGTTRVNAEQLADQLHLKKGMAIDDDLVMNTRTRLLSIG